MIGGVEDRDNQMFDTESNTWSTLPKLPEKHNLSCVVGLNYKDKAVFTFMADGKFNIRAACMPFKEVNNKLEAQEMKWAIEVKQEVHHIDRFHMKSALIA